MNEAVHLPAGGAYPTAEIFSDFQIPSAEGLFIRSQPIEVEIGCGYGEFLTAIAQDHPLTNFLGVDRKTPCVEKGNKRKRLTGLANLAFVRAEAHLFVQHVLARSSVSAFHIYFPDPWPKRKHHRRRLLNPSFFALLHNRLIAGGWVYLGTDDAAYFEWMKRAATAAEVAWDSWRQSRDERLSHPLLRTRYESKYISAKKPIYYLELNKVNLQKEMS